MGTKRIVIDTNNIIAAFEWNGNSRKLIKQVIGSKYKLIVSSTQLKELERVLKYPKFKFSETQQQSILAIIKAHCVIEHREISVDVCKGLI